MAVGIVQPTGSGRSFFAMVQITDLLFQFAQINV